MWFESVQHPSQAQTTAGCCNEMLLRMLWRAQCSHVASAVSASLVTHVDLQDDKVHRCAAIAQSCRLRSVRM